MTDRPPEPDEGEEATYEMVMPIINVTSRGGRFDDTAYAAGWEIGALEARLALRPQGFDRLRTTIRRDNVEQADLIAMNAGATLSIDDMDGLPDAVVAEWAQITIEWF